jgi:hypothetical protein
MFTEAVLVVNRTARVVAKLLVVDEAYAVFDQHGRPLGAAHHLWQSATTKLIAVFVSGQFVTQKLQVIDASGDVVMTLTRPAKLLKSRVIVWDATGDEVGRIIPQNTFGRWGFSLVADRHQLGSITTGDRRAGDPSRGWRRRRERRDRDWNCNIHDHSGHEIAVITKSWQGPLKEAFPTAATYVMQIHRPLDAPLRTLVVAAALSVDIALRPQPPGLLD